MGNLWDYRSCVWDYREATWTLDRDLVGYDVEASDGGVGTVVRAANEASCAYVVVDAGSLVPAARKLVPAGVIASLDHDRGRVEVDLTRSQVRDSPDVDPAHWDDQVRRQLEDYYGRPDRSETAGQ